jgi:hypothetical protein
MKTILRSCLILVLAALAGCSRAVGPQTMRVWGDVSFEGKSVEDGTITFESTDGSPPAQGPIRSGHYDLPAESGPVAAKTYIVKFSAMAKTGKSVPNIMGDGAPTMDLLVETLPTALNTESTIKKTIAPDAEKNQINFKLQKSGRYE